MGLTTQGSMHDYQLLKEELHWYEGQKNWFELLEIYVDLGYKGIDKEFLIKKLNIPFRKPRKTKKDPDPQLTEEQKLHNKAVSQTRILVEHAVGSMKFFNVLKQDYRNRRCGFDDLSIEICAGLHNLYIKLKTD